MLIAGTWACQTEDWKRGHKFLCRSWDGYAGTKPKELTLVQRAVLDIIVQQYCSKKGNADPILRDCADLAGVAEDAVEASDSGEEIPWTAKTLEDNVKGVFKDIYVQIGTFGSLYLEITVESVGSFFLSPILSSTGVFV